MCLSRTGWKFPRGGRGFPYVHWREGIPLLEALQCSLSSCSWGKGGVNLLIITTLYQGGREVAKVAGWIACTLTV